MFSNQNHVVEKEFLMGIGYTAQSEYFIDKYYKGSILTKIEKFLSRGKVNEHNN